MDIAGGHADGREAAGGDGGDGGRAARTTTGRYRHGTNIHEVAAGCWNIDSVRLFFYTADLVTVGKIQTLISRGCGFTGKTTQPTLKQTSGSDYLYSSY